MGAATLALRGGLGRVLLALVLWAPTLGFAVAAALSQARLWAFNASSALPTVGAMVFVGLVCLMGSVFVGLSRRGDPQLTSTP